MCTIMLKNKAYTDEWVHRSKNSCAYGLEKYMMPLVYRISRPYQMMPLVLQMDSP